jgi:hypothetical protein
MTMEPMTAEREAEIRLLASKATGHVAPALKECLQEIDLMRAEPLTMMVEEEALRALLSREGAPNDPLALSVGSLLTTIDALRAIVLGQRKVIAAADAIRLMCGGDSGYAMANGNHRLVAYDAARATVITPVEPLTYWLIEYREENRTVGFLRDLRRGDGGFDVYLTRDPSKALRFDDEVGARLIINDEAFDRTIPHADRFFVAPHCGS